MGITIRLSDWSKRSGPRNEAAGAEHRQGVESENGEISLLVSPFPGPTPILRASVRVCVGLWLYLFEILFILLILSKLLLSEYRHVLRFEHWTIGEFFYKKMMQKLRRDYSHKTHVLALAQKPSLIPAAFINERSDPS